ncbi:NTP transferase domain-containing protein [Microbacterium sp. NPDC076911]|uniref:nucleotidyltransferase family protein n=1 Tax=Microbacterium sp. NPDC076911 TaxID=3154958 RepID=UPI00344A45A1
MCEPVRVCGLVLAAGAGTRYGLPKGLARTDDDTPWVHLSIAMLHDAGCDEVIVLVGARGQEVGLLVGERARVVEVPDWADGLSVTIRDGLQAAAGCDVAVITPVDTPGAAAGAVRRVISHLDAQPRSALVQAMYGDRPGHPVAVGREHFEPLARALVGDSGARAYLAAHAATEVDCADLWSGADIDTRH